MSTKRKEGRAGLDPFKCVLRNIYCHIRIPLQSIQPWFKSIVIDIATALNVIIVDTNYTTLDFLSYVLYTIFYILLFMYRFLSIFLKKQSNPYEYLIIFDKNFFKKVSKNHCYIVNNYFLLLIYTIHST